MLEQDVHTGLCLEGRYRLLPGPKEGSYSLVFKAEDLNARAGEPRVVIIKILCPDVRGPVSGKLRAKLEENFKLEAEALDRARHDHVVNLISKGSAQDLTGRSFEYQVLEYMAGGTMEERCWQKRLTLDEALDYLKQIVSALTCAHQYGYIHRDIKPENFLLSEDYRTVKLADFGVARREQDDGSMTLVGSVTYAAPEHHPLWKQRSGGHISPASDVYSLGKSFYRMICNEKPDDFNGRPITEWPVSVDNEPWAQNLIKVIYRATQDEPHRRQQSAAEFLHEVRRAVESARPKQPPRKPTQGKIKAASPKKDKPKNIVSSQPRKISLPTRMRALASVLAIVALWLVLSVPKHSEVDKSKTSKPHQTLASLSIGPEQLTGLTATPLPDIDVNLREEAGRFKNLVCIINRQAKVKVLGPVKYLGKDKNFKWFKVEITDPGDTGETFCRAGTQGWAFGEKLQVELDEE